jgi:hypothetical protein
LKASTEDEDIEDEDEEEVKVSSLLLIRIHHLLFLAPKKAKPNPTKKVSFLTQGNKKEAFSL